MKSFGVANLIFNAACILIFIYQILFEFSPKIINWICCCRLNLTDFGKVYLVDAFMDALAGFGSRTGHIQFS